MRVLVVTLLQNDISLHSCLLQWVLCGRIASAFTVRCHWRLKAPFVVCRKLLYPYKKDIYIYLPQIFRNLLPSFTRQGLSICYCYRQRCVVPLVVWISHPLSRHSKQMEDNVYSAARIRWFYPCWTPVRSVCYTSHKLNVNSNDNTHKHAILFRWHNIHTSWPR